MQTSMASPFGWDDSVCDDSGGGPVKLYGTEAGLLEDGPLALDLRLGPVGDQDEFVGLDALFVADDAVLRDPQPCQRADQGGTSAARGGADDRSLDRPEDEGGQQTADDDEADA